MPNVPISGVVFIVLINYLHRGHALQCWSCSSDIDRNCADPFNSTDILRYGGGNYYQQPGAYNQGYNPGGGGGYNQQGYNRNYDQRNYDRNYDQARNYDPQRNYDQRNYDPNYPRDYQNQNPNRPRFSPQLSGGNPGPRLINCNEDEARLSRMRTVCIKKVQRIGSDLLTYIRRCDMIPFDRDIGTCHDPVSRDISLDFCEYCDWDGCNSAGNVKINLILAGSMSFTLLWLFRRYFV